MLLKKSTLCALSLLLVAGSAAPALAKEIGQSKFIKAGKSDYVPSGSFKQFLEGNVSQSQSISEDAMQQPLQNAVPVNQPPMNDGGTGGGMMMQQQMPMQQPMQQQTMMQVPMQQGLMMQQQPMMQQPMQQPMMQQQGMMQDSNPYSTTDMSKPLPPSADNSGAAAGAAAATGNPMLAMMAGAAGGGGMDNAVAGAAGLALAGQMALNSLGDAMRGMGFSGGFHGMAPGASNYSLSPFGGTGLGYHGPGTLFGGGGDAAVGDGMSSGGGGGPLGGVTRTVNGALNRNINYAADQVTNKLIGGMWGGRGGGGGALGHPIRQTRGWRY